jgi:hypothetical protein
MIMRIGEIKEKRTTVVMEGELSYPPIVIAEVIDLDLYDDITSIESWDLYKNYTKIGIVKDNMKSILNDLTWENLSLNEKKIVSKYFLVEKDKRDEVLTQEEQDSHNYFKLYELLSEDIMIGKGISNYFVTPKSIDYKKDVDGRLHPKYTIQTNGWLTECEYFRNLTISQNEMGFTQYDYSDPILKYEATYQIKDDGYVGSRTVTRRWYKLDGSLDADAKVSVKFYEPMLAREEGKTRRKNIINKLIIDTVGLFIITSPDLNTVLEAEEDAISFMRYVASGIADYYEYGSKSDQQGNPCKLVLDVINSTYPRLDNFVPGTNNTLTIRQFIINRLNV